MPNMYIKNKRGLSPIIATVLLVVIVIVLGTIIYIWARGFVTEKIQKFDEPIENSCPAVAFGAEAYGGQVRISNDGTIPIYGLEIKKVKFGSTSLSGVIPFGSTVMAGQTGEVDLPLSVNEGDSIVVLPVLLGESGNVKKSYTCDSGVDATVEA